MPRRPAALTSSMLYFQMVIMAGTVMLAYYFEYTDTFTVNVQGFFCHDSAYRKPYPGPEDSSAVPPVLLYSLAAGVPVLVVSPGWCSPSPSPSGWRPAAGRAGAAAFASRPSCCKFVQPLPQRAFLRGAQGGGAGGPRGFPHVAPAALAAAAAMGDGGGDGGERTARGDGEGCRSEGKVSFGVTLVSLHSVAWLQ